MCLFFWGFHVVGLLMIIHMQFISCFSILNSTFFCFIFVVYNETYHMQLFLLFDCWCLMHIVSIYIHPRRSLISKSLQMLLYFSMCTRARAIIQKKTASFTFLSAFLYLKIIFSILERISCSCSSSTLHLIPTNKQVWKRMGKNRFRIMVTSK